MYLRDLVLAVWPLYESVVVVCNRGGLDHWFEDEEIHRRESIRVAEWPYLTRSELHQRLSGISWKLKTVGMWLYDRLTPWLHRRLASRILRAYDPDAVFCANHGSQSVIWPLMRLCGSTGIPAATYLLGMPAMFNRLPHASEAKLDRRMWDAARLVIVNAQAVADAMACERGIPLRKTVVIPNGLPDAAPPSRVRTQDVVTIGTLGRLMPSKGVRHLVDALRVERERGRAVRLVIVGEGPDSENLKDQVSQLDLDELVEFRGFVSTGQIDGFLEAIDVFALASESEGLPYVLIEAMRACLPVVATAVGGVPEIVEDGVTGLLVEPRSPQQLAAAFERLVEDSELRDRLARAGRERFDERFTDVTMHAAIRKAFLGSGMVPTASTGRNAGASKQRSREVDAPCG